MMSIYQRPFRGETPDEFYPPEPTDEQANVLARGLAHWMVAYLPDEQDRTAQSIVLDILESNAASTCPLAQDEMERIAAAVGVEAPDPKPYVAGGTAAARLRPPESAGR